MSSFFTSGFAAKQDVPRQVSSPSPDEKEDIASAKAGPVAGDSWVMLNDREGRPLWWNSSTGEWIYYSTPVPQGFNNFLTPSPALSTAVATHGYHVGNAGLYGPSPQAWAVAPAPTSATMPLAVPVSNPEEEKKKSSGKYYVWEKFYDEEGGAIWIHSASGKRTRVDPYW